MRTRLAVFTFVVPVLMASAACDNKEKEQAAAAEKTRELDEKASRERREADEKAEAAKRDVADSARQSAAEARAALQKDLDAADRKFAYLKTKAATATGAAKKNVEAAMNEADQRRGKVGTELKKLESESGAAWDAAKVTATQSISALNQAIDSLETTVTGKPAK